MGDVFRLAISLFAVQAGFHGFTGSLPVALARAGVPDPEIGIIVGTAAIVQLPAAFLAGVIIDRVGGLRVFTFGGIAYLIGCGILLLPGVEPGGPSLPFFLARICQGIGVASVFPAALSLAPRIVPRARRGFGLAFVGAAHNLTLVVMPAVALSVLGLSSLHGVAAVVSAIVIGGLVLVRIRPFVFRDEAARPGEASEGPTSVAHRRYGFAFRRSLVALIAITVLFVSQWGFLIAYLPQRAEAAGAEIGLFFVANGLFIMGARVPTGWLADRTRAICLILAGVASTSVAVTLLLLTPTTPILILAGVLEGGGAGLVMTPVLVELSRRSGDADRGSAFSLFSAGLAVALMLGSIGGAPLIGAFGFEPVILVGLAGLAGAAGIAVTDKRLWLRPRAGSGSAPPVDPGSAAPIGAGPV